MITAEKLIARGFNPVQITGSQTDYIKRYPLDQMTLTEKQSIIKEVRDAPGFVQVYSLRSPAVKHVTVVVEFRV